MRPDVKKVVTDVVSIQVDGHISRKDRTEQDYRFAVAPYFDVGGTPMHVEGPSLKNPVPCDFLLFLPQYRVRYRVGKPRLFPPANGMTANSMDAFAAIVTGCRVNLLTVPSRLRRPNSRSPCHIARRLLIPNARTALSSVASTTDTGESARRTG